MADKLAGKKKLYTTLYSLLILDDEESFIIALIAFLKLGAPLLPEFIFAREPKPKRSKQPTTNKRQREECTSLKNFIKHVQGCCVKLTIKKLLKMLKLTRVPH